MSRSRPARDSRFAERPDVVGEHADRPGAGLIERHRRGAGAPLMGGIDIAASGRKQKHGARAPIIPFQALVGERNRLWTMSPVPKSGRFQHLRSRSN